MATHNYPKYKILIDPDSKKTQGLRVGDVARREYSDSSGLIYSLMVVTETGVDIIGEKESYYFVGALIEGDEPKSGEILDFVRITNLFDTDRSGALYLTASDNDSPFMDVIDGLAYENSLSFPYMMGGSPDKPNRNQYSCTGERYLNISYKPSEEGAERILRLTRNKIENTAGEIIGLKQPIDVPIKNPQRLIVSYKIKASKEGKNIPVSLSYTNDKETDGFDVIDISLEWAYKLHLITVDYPSQYQRCWNIDLSAFLNAENAWCEIADLNIVRQADIATFSHATKARVGKIKGIVDPVFGILDGYGAYFQNLYATKNVNIAGTLTAGDENGFSSTFYVGKIHKNVIRNSVEPEFLKSGIVKMTENTPVGIGYSWQIEDTVSLLVQQAEWRKKHLGEFYCFSFWAKSEELSTLSIYQDEFYLGEIVIDSNDWKRVHVSFPVKNSDSSTLSLRIDTTVSGAILCAPQLEAGRSPSQYQPTDGTLSYTEDYGAWFNKGGIGGTIQNPLLKLNNDGSISSRDNSFVIHPDGTGHFASGRFKWNKDTITLQDVTIRWESFDEETQETLIPKSVHLSGTDIFHYDDEFDSERCEPNEICVFASEVNFSGVSRRWQYKASNETWKDLPGNNDFIKILPMGHYWEERNVLTIKFISTYKNTEYEDTFTIFKQFDGQSAYSIYIVSSEGHIFKNGIISTTLTALVYKGGEDITALIPDKNFSWKRVSGNKETDMLWNQVEHTGKNLVISGEDVYHKAVFDCEVILSKK